MVDNRSAGFYGIGGSFNFKSGDISGTAARTQDDKMGQGGEYFAQQKREEEELIIQNPYMDRSAQLRATLNSLAMMNVANVINNRKRSIIEDSKDAEEKSEEKEDNEREALEKLLSKSSKEDEKEDFS